MKWKVQTDNGIEEFNTRKEARAFVKEMKDNNNKAKLIKN